MVSHVELSHIFSDVAMNTHCLPPSSLHKEYSDVGFMAIVPTGPTLKWLQVAMATVCRMVITFIAEYSCITLVIYMYRWWCIPLMIIPATVCLCDICLLPCWLYCADALTAPLLFTCGVFYLGPAAVDEPFTSCWGFGFNDFTTSVIPSLACSFRFSASLMRPALLRWGLLLLMR